MFPCEWTLTASVALVLKVSEWPWCAPGLRSQSPGLPISSFSHHPPPSAATLRRQARCRALNLFAAVHAGHCVGADNITLCLCCIMRTGEGVLAKPQGSCSA